MDRQQGEQGSKESIADGENAGWFACIDQLCSTRYNRTHKHLKRDSVTVRVGVRIGRLSGTRAHPHECWQARQG